MMRELLNTIRKRQSARIPFDSERPVVKKDLGQILEAGRWAPTAHNMQNFEIIIIDDKKVLSALEGVKSTVSETFIQENYQQLSFSEEELLQKKVGILGTVFPKTWRTPGYKPNKDTDSRRPIQISPVLLVVVYDPDRRAPASEGDFLGIVSLGCVMENMWLMANSLGISFHVVSAIGTDPVEKEIKSILNIPDHLKIPFAFRLGYPASPPAKYMRVRRDIKDFVHHNRFGTRYNDFKDFGFGL
jgi:nitroreductase